ncbi:MAG: hypothetical protein JXB13_02500, partial [Phycisphaerae bacterium]|nr:hypothetical protein [Phycisphaerae bacterium]
MKRVPWILTSVLMLVSLWAYADPPATEAGPADGLTSEQILEQRMLEALARQAERKAELTPADSNTPPSLDEDADRFAEQVRALLASLESSTQFTADTPAQEDPPAPAPEPKKPARERPRKKPAEKAPAAHEDEPQPTTPPAAPAGRAPRSADRAEQPARDGKRPPAKTPPPPAEEAAPPMRVSLGSTPTAPATPRGTIDFGQIQLTGNDITIESVGTGLLILGHPDDVAIIQALIEQMDEEIPARDLQILTLKNKKASEVAQGVQKILDDLYKKTGEQRPEEKVSVSALSANIILVAAPSQKMEQTIKIIEAIDAVPAPLPEVELMTFDIKYRKPSEVAEQLSDILNKLRQRVGAEEVGAEFDVQAFDDTGKITILGPVSERDKIQAIINEIDAEPREGFGQIKLVLFPLLNNKADDMADTLKELLAIDTGKDAAEETIRRLQMLKQGKDGTREELPPVDLQKPIKIIPDDGTESLIVATAEENIEPLAALIEVLDGVPLATEMGLQIFNLKYADADTVKELLEEMFKQGKDLPEAAPGSADRQGVPEGVVGESLVYNIAVSADLRTNTLIVTGRPGQVALAARIIAELDQEGSEIKFPLQIVPLEHSSASRLATVIDELFTARVESLEAREAGKSAVERERVFVTSDERTNSLIVSASTENYAELLRVVEQLDTPAEKLFEHIRLITCKNTSAADLASKIEELWERKAQLRQDAELPEDMPIVVADQRSNALVIASSPDDFEAIKSLVDRLEAQPLAPIAEIRLVQLQHNDATEVSDMLKDLFEERLQQRLVSGQEEDPTDRVAVATDASTNIILVASSKANYDEMVRIIQAIDVEPDLEGVIRMFSLKNAVAKDVAEKIKDLFDQGIYTPQKGLKSDLAEARQEVAIVDDPRSNSLIVSASKPNLTMIEQLIGSMDVEEPLNVDSKTEIFTLQFADAIKLADTMEKMFEGIQSSASEPDLFPEPTIIPDARNNILIVTGTRDALKRCANLLAIVDVEAGPPSATFEVYQLMNASVARLAPMMQEMFDKRDEGTDEKRSPIFIQAEEATNTLICTAAREDHALITGLLKLLDKPSEIAKQVEIFPLKAAKAEAMADRLETLFKSQAGTQGGTDRADVLAVEPDVRTNALIVWAAPSEMANIAEIIHKLDTTQPGPEMMVKVIQLQRALAEDFAQVLDETLNGQGGGGQDEAAAIIKFETTLPDGRKEVRSLVRQDITIQADQKTNSLMVMAPAGSMEMLESLISTFDRMPPVLAEIRLFPLVNADAEEVVSKLEDLFEEGGSGAGDIDTQLTVGNLQTLIAEGKIGLGTKVPMKFSSDRRTNTVLAAGAEIDLRMVDQLVRMLDAPDVDERVLEIYEAKYITADEIATALTSFAEQETQRLQDVDDETAAQRRAERHVTAISDEGSNSVLLGVSPRFYSHYMTMIQQIDRPPPQVMIQVLVAEVTLTDTVGVGFEFAAQDLRFTENAVVGPNDTVQGSGFDAVGGTDLGAAAVAGSMGGFSFSITGEDFNFLFKALQSDGIVEILSRPTIFVANNSPGNIQIGDQVPIVQGTSTSDSGQISSTVNYQDTGIILNVTPHINPDGYVNLEVAPEISQLSPSTVQISEGFNAPIITKRSAETIVTVKDGETVVIGGLIQTNESETETKVPIVGDIPGLGALFRSTTVESRRTELLIVLTVNVCRTEDD